jgi:hypothetical protein
MVEPTDSGTVKSVRITVEINGWTVDVKRLEPPYNATEIFTDYTAMGARVNSLLTEGGVALSWFEPKP